MSVRIIQGLPGSGQTLYTMHLIIQALSEKRHVYLLNFDNVITDEGLQYFNDLAAKSGVTFTISELIAKDFDVNLRFETEDDTDEKKYPTLHRFGIPDGSTLFIDEAHMFFPTRPSTRPVPPFVEFLRVHRHTNTDVTFISQNVSFIDSDIRRVSDDYLILSRLMNGNFCRQEFYASCPDSVQRLMLSHLKTEHWRYPKDLFRLYKSSVKHTVKFRIPARLKLLFVLIPVVAIAFLTIYFTFISFGKTFKSSGSVRSSAPVPPASVPASVPPASVPASVPPASVPASVPPASVRPASVPASVPPAPVPVASNSLGKGLPSVYDLASQTIYYSGYYSVAGKATAVLNLYNPNTASCAPVSQSFFLALGYSVKVTRDYVAFSKLVPAGYPKVRPIIIPNVPSPCSVGLQTASVSSPVESSVQSNVQGAQVSNSSGSNGSVNASPAPYPKTYSNN